MNKLYRNPDGNRNVWIMFSQTLGWIQYTCCMDSMCVAMPWPQQRTCKANEAGENSSFIFTVCVRSVPRYYFKLANVILQMVVKELFETHF